MQKMGLLFDIIIYNILVDGFCRIGEIFEVKNFVNKLLDLYVVEGFVLDLEFIQDCVKMVNNVIDLNVYFDVIIYIILIDVYCK